MEKQPKPEFKLPEGITEQQIRNYFINRVKAADSVGLGNEVIYWTDNEGFFFISPEVMAFAANMQREMNANSHKESPGNSWKNLSRSDVSWALSEYHHHEGKLHDAIRSGNVEEIREHIGDVANTLMFLARIFSLL